ncbi:ISAs1 family transposase [Microcoleus sp. S36b_A4]|uniref:ISAs1 family transposase n=1 Tax=Microcoleus sp. S36b_A4 TaxID=3055420 RepID=UPI002FD53813
MVFISSIGFRSKKVDKKSNELTAVPQLIEMLEIAGSVITIDAMGCQKDITSLIIKKKGDYVLALNGNQKLLYQAVKEWFEVAKKEDYLGRDYSPA